MRDIYTILSNLERLPLFIYHRLFNQVRQLIHAKNKKVGRNWTPLTDTTLRPKETTLATVLVNISFHASNAMHNDINNLSRETNLLQNLPNKFPIKFVICLRQIYLDGKIT